MSAVKAERFFGNDHKSLLEGELTSLALEFGANTKRALVLCGFNAARHQRMTRRWDSVLFAEIAQEHYRIAVANAAGMNKRYMKNGSFSTQRTWKRDNSAPQPRSSRFFNEDVFKTFDRYQNFGLVDLDFCCTVSAMLLLGVHKVINNNRVDDRWALRVTISQRGKKASGTYLCEQVQKMIELSSYRLVKEEVIRYSEPKKDSNRHNTPMMMVQWLMEPK